MSNAWIIADRLGLKQQAKERGPAIVFLELIANALDEEGCDAITVNVEMLANRPLAQISIEDNGTHGFRILEHAYTLFSSSYKRDNPKQRGRFNFGEKLFLSLCQEAQIKTTTGTLVNFA